MLIDWEAHLSRNNIDVLITMSFFVEMYFGTSCAQHGRWLSVSTTRLANATADVRVLRALLDGADVKAGSMQSTD
jgi:hypothetical protein